ncbi:diguanylate cyclase [Thermosynechococcus sp. GLH187]|uniref:diguanylate cyclase domain-containing protein n=1 Tax=unclassified Thermosynechococcus TaxID=2622553 RepID=UPI0028774AE0|nr:MULTISPECIES: diguanylate cyclase [unclassified Thermosynechococcus]WNC46039.1 diguanylate cyclase [Thermosynechococcus sp. GLH187]WNC48575.1 diguanylate cyclase [Thermosynechococcus sp. GLH333]WNC51108.1 diguanylate cyclase [Thermosynechococcus sp. GLH87]
MEQLNSGLNLQALVQAQLVTIAPRGSFNEILQGLQSNQGLGLVVEEQGQFRGLITQREVIRALGKGYSPQAITAAQIMLPSDYCLRLSDLDDPLAILGRFRYLGVDALAVVNESGRVEGLLTRQAFRESLRPVDLLRIKRVAEVMVPDVATIAAEASLQEAAVLMTERGVTSLVVPEASASGVLPRGIITEKDIFEALQGQGGVLTGTVGSIMSQPVLTVKPNQSLWQVNHFLKEHQVRRVVVVDDDGQMVGIVTQSNLLAAIDITEAQGVIQVLTQELNKATAELRWQLSRQQAITVAITESEQRYNTLISHLPVAIYRRDRDRLWRFSYVSDQIYHLTGYFPQDLPDLRQIIPAPDLALAERDIEQAIRQQRAYSTTYRIQHRDGCFRWLSDRGQLDPQSHMLHGVLLDVSEQQRTEERLKTALEREMIVSTIIQDIRQSIRLEDILQRAVTSIQQLLLSDRVLIYRFLADGSGVVEVEATTSPQYSILGQVIHDPCFSKETAQRFLEGRTVTISDVNQAQLQDCYRELLLSLQVQANLVVPLLQGQDLWGLLIAHQCRGPRLWQREELFLLQRIAEPLTVALQQAEMYAALEAANANLQQMVYIDSLTDIGNRRCFDELFAKEWRRCQREQQPLSLVMLDIDCFKAYNDHYGHLQGDQILKQVAQILESHLQRAGDLATRFGGEEFALLLPSTDQAGAIHIVEKLQQALAEANITHAKSTVGPQLTASFGIATTLPTPEHEPAMLLHLADQCLYEAKTLGRDRWVAKEL